jgi:cyclopropane fatty-acyl-phospholipid synthase-like methyltransferase
MNMRRLQLLTGAIVLLAWASQAAQRPAGAVRAEVEQAERDVPKLADALALKPGMIVADIGAGGGAMAVSLAKFLGVQGRVYATDIGQAQLAEIRDS